MKFEGIQWQTFSSKAVLDVSISFAILVQICLENSMTKVLLKNGTQQGYQNPRIFFLGGGNLGKMFSSKKKLWYLFFYYWWEIYERQGQDYILSDESEERTCIRNEELDQEILLNIADVNQCLIFCGYDEFCKAVDYDMKEKICTLFYGYPSGSEFKGNQKQTILIVFFFFFFNLLASKINEIVLFFFLLLFFWTKFCDYNVGSYHTPICGCDSAVVVVAAKGQTASNLAKSLKLGTIKEIVSTLCNVSYTRA